MNALFAINNINTPKYGSERITIKIVIRKLLVFTIFFIATKDIVVSAILSGIFLILVCCIFNENSRMCMFKTSLKSFCKNRKELVSKADYENAKKIVKEYEEKLKV